LAEERIPTGDIGKAMSASQVANEEQIGHALTGVTVAAIEGLDVMYLTRLCQHHKLDIRNHWKLCKEFLELITKSEMMVVADELGIRAALGENFKKVFAKSKTEVIDALLAVEGFDYAGKVPKVLNF
jgi:ParB family chromosome partitioning protein